MELASFGKWSIRKHERGFNIIWNGEPRTESFPWIPKWYLKPLYPWALWQSVKAIKELRDAYLRI